MLNKPALNAKEMARPLNKSGVALSSVRKNDDMLPNEPCRRDAYATKGLAPENVRIIAQTTDAINTAIKGITIRGRRLLRRVAVF